MKYLFADTHGHFYYKLDIMERAILEPIADTLNMPIETLINQAIESYVAVLKSLSTILSDSVSTIPHDIED
jgi:hypothetical protein